MSSNTNIPVKHFIFLICIIILCPFVVHAANGDLKWSYTTGGDIDSSPAIGSDGTIYIGSDDTKLYAINTDGTEKWNFTTGSVIQSSPAIGSDGTIYIGSWDTKLYAINTDGTEKWNFASENSGTFGITSSPTIAQDGTIYFTDGSGYYLYSIDSDGVKKWSNLISIGNELISSVSIAQDGTIYIGCEDNKLYAIEGSSAPLYTQNDFFDGTTNSYFTMRRNQVVLISTPALSNIGIIDSSESTLRIGWKENDVVDSVRIYQGTNTNLIATEDTSYVSLASYTVGNLDADTGYNFWLEPWDGAVSGIKYYVSGTTDGDGGGGGGGGDPTPTATATPGPTPGPTAPPWTNITDEDWLNFTQYEQKHILQEHDNLSIGTYTPIPTEISFWYLILFLGICSTAYGFHRNDEGVLFAIGIVLIVISAIKLHLL